jgi:hypothetical protein
MKLVAGITMGAIAAGVTVSAMASSPSHPRLSERQILRIAFRAAAANDDPRPTLIQHSEGTRCDANRVASGGCVGGSNWSYLIAERGHFIAKFALTPAGAPVPRGTVITLVVDAASGRVTDGGISYRYPPLAQLSRVSTDFRSYLTCPGRDRQKLTSMASGAKAQLVPSGARRVLVCRYGGLNSGFFKMRLVNLRLVLDAATVTRLANEFNALKPFPTGSISCPADFGQNIIAIFSYRPGPRSDDPVTVDTSGCAPVTNGNLTRTAMFQPGPALLGQLKGMTNKPH